jgi:hypothetical protein
MSPVTPKAQPTGLSPEVASASAHPKVAIAVDPLCQDANQPDLFRVKPLRRRNIFCCIDIPSTLQPTRLASTTPAHEVFFEAIAPSSTTSPGPPLASTRSGWPVATPELALPEGNVARREARCDQRLQPTHTLKFSKTSTRVLCGYCRRFPFDSGSPFFTLAIHFGGPPSQMKSLLFPSDRRRPSLCCPVISAHLAETNVNLDQARLQTHPREQTHSSSDKSSFRSTSTPREGQLGFDDLAVDEHPDAFHRVAPRRVNVGNHTVRWCHQKALADFCSAAQPAGTTAGTSLSSSRELTA